MSNCLSNLFKSNGVQPGKAIDAIVYCIQQRKDSVGACSYDFLPPSYLTALTEEYTAFLSTPSKGDYKFPDHLTLPQPNRPEVGDWLSCLYCPYLIDGSHWVGVAFDLQACSISVLDCNIACVTNEEVQGYLKPIAQMLPYMLRQSVGDEVWSSKPMHPFHIYRLDVELLAEFPGLSAVASLILVELHATKILSHNGEIEA
ncbi:unnamed protein product [Microthlaspi erraticum]|uniref:Ubiquitin-like protease family profile domain-containing protein n=1 Tax=Microthlaspi erraticum TaxID=1685480 RepID=A0A6D2JSP2_9BRAS|nr:unnamed protein product [Microthlaspi erraticum]